MTSSAATPTRFSAAEDKELIEMVAGHSLLWDMMDVDFKNSYKKVVLWTEIGKTVNKTGPQCRVRWRSIRDHYKRQKKSEDAGSAATKKRASYWDRLRFLDGEVDEKESFINNHELSESSEEEITAEDPLAEEYGQVCEIKQCPKEDPEVEPPTFQTKRKKLKSDNAAERSKERQQEEGVLESYVEKRLEPEEDELDLFFKTMALTVRKLEPEMQTEAKIKVFKLVTDLEIKSQRTKKGVHSFSTFN